MEDQPLKIADRTRHHLRRSDIKLINSNEQLRKMIYSASVHAAGHYIGEAPRVLHEHPVMAVAFIRKAADVLEVARQISNGSQDHARFEAMLYETAVRARATLPQSMRNEYFDMLAGVVLQEVSAMQKRGYPTSS